MYKQLILIALCVTLTLTLFKDDSEVFKLTAKNFQDQVVNSDDFWLVEFYAPWCGHCKQSAPEFQKAAEILSGVMRVGAVNMDEERGAGQPYKVQGYPTIKFFGANKKVPLDFQSGQRTFDKFVEYCVSKMKEEIASRQRNQPTEL